MEGNPDSPKVVPESAIVPEKEQTDEQSTTGPRSKIESSHEDEEYHVLEDEGCHCWHVFLYKMTLAMVKYTCLWFWLFLLICLILTGVGLSSLDPSKMFNMELDFFLVNHETTDNFDMLRHARAQTDAVKGHVQPREREDPDQGKSTNLIFEWKDQDKKTRNDDIFTAKNVQSMCKIEQLLLSHADFPDFCQLSYKTPRGKPETSTKCTAQSLTAAGTIYSKLTGAYAKDCVKLDDAEVKTAALCLYYFHFIDDKVKTQEAAKTCSCFNYRTFPGHKDQNCDSKCTATATCKYNVKKMCGTIPCDPTESNIVVKKFKQQGAGLFLSKGVADDPKAPSTGITRSMLFTGSPLFRDGEKVGEDAAKALNKAFFLAVERDIVKETGPPRDPYKTPNFIGDLKIMWLQGDMALVTGENLGYTEMAFLAISITFVWAYMRFHTDSWFMSMIGLVQILLAFPVAVFFFRYVFWIEYMGFMNWLVLFLVMGVGADDMFVLVDAWKQTSYMVLHMHKGLKPVSREHARLIETVEHSMQAVWNTSITTACAFFATAFGPLVLFKSFGIFAGICILMLFFFIVLWNPLSILIWHRYWQHTNCCCCCADKPFCKCLYCCARGEERPPVKLKILRALSASGAAESKPAVGKSKTLSRSRSRSGTFRENPDQSQNNSKKNKCSMEKCFGGCFFNIIAFRLGASSGKVVNCDAEVLTEKYNMKVNEQKRCFPIVALVIVLLTLGFTAFSTYQTILLFRSPAGIEEMLPPDNMLAAAPKSLKDDFFGGDEDQYLKIDIAWGLEEFDRSGYDIWAPNDMDNRGKVAFSKKFSALSDFTTTGSSSAATHKSMLDACDILKKAKCDEGQDGLLALSGGVEKHCWPLHFKTWVTTQGKTFPKSNEKEYFDLLKSYRATDPKLWGNIGIIDGKLRFAALTFTSSSKAGSISLIGMEKLQKCSLDVVKEINANTKKNFQAEKGGESNMQGLFPHDHGLNFMTIYTSEEYIKSFTQGTLISSVIVFAVLLFATGNILVAIYALLTIASILVWVLGFFKWAMGSDMGLVLSLAGSIVIGFSVDYCIHIAHMYTEAEASTARGRMHFAMTKMGGTVLGGAATTLGAGVALFGTVTSFFITMAVILTITILASVYHALFFFPSLCLLIGPSNSIGNIYCCKKGTKKE